MLNSFFNQAFIIGFFMLKSVMWECLADAYLNRGSLTASLKSFNKAIELNPESTYAYYQ